MFCVMTTFTSIVSLDSYEIVLFKLYFIVEQWTIL